VLFPHLGQRCNVVNHLAAELIERQGLALKRRTSNIGSCQRQQIVHEPREADDLLQVRGQDLLVLVY
jgi:hypothetical protein